MLVFGQTDISFTALCSFIFDYMDDCFNVGLCIAFGLYRFALIDYYVFSLCFRYFCTNVLYSDFNH